MRLCFRITDVSQSDPRLFLTTWCLWNKSLNLKWISMGRPAPSLLRGWLLNMSDKTENRYISGVHLPFCRDLHSPGGSQKWEFSSNMQQSWISVTSKKLIGIVVIALVVYETSSSHSRTCIYLYMLYVACCFSLNRGLYWYSCSGGFCWIFSIHQV